MANPYTQTIRGENLSYDQVFEQIQHEIPHTEGAVVTTLPRGSLQIAQPQGISEPLIKSYAREFHSEDRPTWQALLRKNSVRASQCWGDDEYDQSRYLREFLVPLGLRDVAAAPLEAPVMQGYPGALHLYRSSEQGGFTEQELNKLAQIAQRLQEAIYQARGSRRTRPCVSRVCQRPRALRQFIFDRQLRPQLNGQHLEQLDERIRHQMLQHAQRYIQHVNGQAVTTDRLPLPDMHGDLWIFRVVVHRQYPALGEGPFAFFCLQPDCGDWSAIRPSDFQADKELARLVPAVRFMEEQFHRGPTLGEIAKTVHLSPFHFHRRFTELLGITPKHFLLNCQIEEAKKQLLARQKDLAKIATDCGFAHQSHFTSRFKQATGLTPTRWRRLALERQQQKVSEN
jgi:AraC-like DNA-binding protein